MIIIYNKNHFVSKDINYKLHLLETMSENVVNDLNTIDLKDTRQAKGRYG